MGDGRFFIVVIQGDDGAYDALSRRTDGDDGPHTGPWRLLDEGEAEQLRDLWNDDDRNDGRAVVVEVYRYDRDPSWPEN